MVFELNSILQYGPEVCSRLIPASEFLEFTRALVCGSKLEPSREKEIFTATGLIHILVVSGAHLHFFDRWLSWMPRRARTVVLLIYCWLTGFGAPIVRSFCRRLLEPNLRRRMFSELQIEAITTLTLLIVIPSWFDSRSLLMSWMCALALALAFAARVSHSLWAQSSIVFLFLYPFCLGSPFSIAYNALLTPLIGLGLFPLCLFSIPLPFLSLASDFFWAQLITVLKAGPEVSATQTMIATKWLIALPWLMQIALLIWEVRWRRQLAFSPQSS